MIIYINYVMIKNRIPLSFGYCSISHIISSSVSFLVFFTKVPVYFTLVFIIKSVGVLVFAHLHVHWCEHQFAPMTQCEYGAQRKLILRLCCDYRLKSACQAV